jgi:hypothetical protein
MHGIGINFAIFEAEPGAKTLGASLSSIKSETNTPPFLLDVT